MRNGICSLFVDLSYKSREHLNFSRPIFRGTGRALYISRRIDGRSFTSAGCVIPSTDSASRLIFHLLSRRGVARRVTSFLCVKVIRSAKIFRCSYASPRAVRINTTLLEGKVGKDTVVSKACFRGSCIRGRVLKGTLLRDVVVLGGGTIISIVHLGRVSFFRTGPSSLSKVIDMLHRAENIRITVLLCRLRPRAFGMDLESGRVISMDTITGCCNNNNRIETTNIAVGNSPRSIVGGLALLVRERLETTRRGGRRG